MSPTGVRSLALFVAIAGVLASVALVRGLFDPDYFWHLATGDLILETRSIPRTDPFSFTWFGEPWIPDQWLAEVAIAAGVATIGAGPLIVVFATIAAVGPAAIAAAALRSGASLASVLVGTAVVTAALMPQVTIRPQVVSFAFTGILLALLIRARPETRHLLWAIPPMILVWANAHGFFIVGLGIGFVYLVATLMGRTPMREHRMLVAGIAGASLVAAMLTPSGPAGLLYALSFGDPSDVGAQRIVEWQSPNFHNPQFLPFLALLGLLFLTGVRGAPGWMAIVALVGALLGLFAVRAIGVGSLMIMPLVILHGPIRLPARAPRAPDTRASTRAWMELGAAAAIAITLVTAAALRGPVAVDPRRAPTTGTEQIRATQPDARVLAAYEWGGYVINELHELGGTVFVDGRMHKFAPQVLADYLAIVEADPGWQALLDRYDPDVLLLYPSMVLVRGPVQAEGWCEVFRDDLQVLLARDCSTAWGDRP